VIDVHDRHLRIGRADDQHRVDARFDAPIAQPQRFLGFELERVLGGVRNARFTAVGRRERFDFRM
jgi:hypothetical protein